MTTINNIKTQKFIQRANSIHSGDYDYSKTEYTTMRGKVRIICPKHGEFWQNAANHLKGNGCPKCTSRVIDTDGFIAKAKKIHGDNFNYDRVNYKTSMTKVMITCNKCGHTFLQRPNNHLSGQGCPVCSQRKKKTLKEFIKEAKLVHGRKYDYSRAVYVNARTKLQITCKSCGHVFMQSPNHHISQKQGCPHCRNKKES